MNVEQLRDLFVNLCERGFEDKEGLFTYQENYPLQDTIEGAWLPEWDTDEEEPFNPHVYLVSGGQCRKDPYGPRQAFDECSEVL
jgi:hypothetical protein